MFVVRSGSYLSPYLFLFAEYSKGPAGPAVLCEKYISPISPSRKRKQAARYVNYYVAKHFLRTSFVSEAALRSLLVWHGVNRASPYITVLAFPYSVSRAFKTGLY